MADMNPETMPLEELKALALAEAAKAEQTATPTNDAKPRNDKGQFVAAGQEEVLDNKEDEEEAAAATTDDATDEPEEYIYKKEIDLGDGSGVQVFYGKGTTQVEALEQLTDKLADAQKNASKKIHELAKQVKPAVEKPKVREFSADEEFTLSQELMTKPSEGFKKLFKETTGYDISDFQSKVQAVEAFEKSQRSLIVQNNFVATHPDYIGNPANGKKLAEWVESHNYSEFTEQNLEKAFQDLKKSGLLDLKAEDADGATAANGTDQKRIASTEQGATQQRSSKKSSTLSTTSRTAPAVKTGPSEDELYSMPMDKLRDLANRQLASKE